MMLPPRRRAAIPHHGHHHHRRHHHHRSCRADASSSTGSLFLAISALVAMFQFVLFSMKVKMMIPTMTTTHHNKIMFEPFITNKRNYSTTRTKRSNMSTRKSRGISNNNNNIISFDFYEKHNNQSTTACQQDVTPTLFDSWKEEKEMICKTENVTITKYTMKRWEYRPTIHVYNNILIKSNNLKRPILPVGQDWMRNKASCTYHQNLLLTNNSETTESSVVVVVQTPVIRIFQNDSRNAYERFHAYLNVAMTMAMFNITNPQLVYITKLPIKEIPQSEIDMWNSFSLLKPIIINVPDDDSDDGDDDDDDSNSTTTATTTTTTTTNTTTTRYEYLIDTFSSETSILVTKSRLGGLKGRGTDHHCRSTVVQGIIRWMVGNLLHTGDGDGDEDNKKAYENNEATLVTSNDSKEESYDNPNDGIVIQILWSSRRPYCCRDNNIYTPARSIMKEGELIQQVQQKLSLGDYDDGDGSDEQSYHQNQKYNITVVDFSNVSTVEAVRLATRSHIMVGVHGAGLIWSSFLPRHRGGLVEIFGGDRSPSNRHYHNIASLVDIHYRSLVLNSRGGRSLVWKNNTVDKIVWKIRSIRYNQEPGDTEPRINIRNRHEK